VNLHTGDPKTGGDKMEPDVNPGDENSEHGTDTAPENAGIEMEDAGLSQNGETPTGPTPNSEPDGWDELQWSLFGLGPDEGKLPFEEKIAYEELLSGDLSEDLSSLDLSSLVGELDAGTRLALKEIDTYASASALAQERAALMGRADDLTMDLRDMQEQIREMEAAQAGLRSVFQVAYRRPDEALRVWGRLVHEIRLGGETRSAGSPDFGKASQILTASPERLGALRGASAFGFSTPARSEAVRATAKAAGLARAYQDAARRATRLGVFGKGQSDENVLGQGVLKKSLSAEKGTTQYPGLFQKREEIEATRKEASALAEKVRELTGRRPLSEQSRAVTERVRSLDPEQRQALRQVILGVGAQSVDKVNREAGRSAKPSREAATRGNGVDRKPALNTPALKRSATARSLSQSQASKKAASKTGAMKGLLKASLRHVAIHVAIRTLDRVEKEARGREMLEI
jgi:hypothetical protein